MAADYDEFLEQQRAERYDGGDEDQSRGDEDERGNEEEEEPEDEQGERADTGLDAGADINRQLWALAETFA